MYTSFYLKEFSFGRLSIKTSMCLCNEFLFRQNFHLGEVSIWANFLFRQISILVQAAYTMTGSLKQQKW